MLLLLFRLGDDRYALDTRDVAAVVPMVVLKRIPEAPDGVAGVFNYRGAPVPVIDLRPPASEGRAGGVNTRIVIIRDPSTRGEGRLIGLVADGATSTLTRTADEFVDPGLAGPRYLGPVTQDGSHVVQRVQVSELLTDEVRARLFRELDQSP